MRFQPGNLTQPLLVVITIVANCVSPVVSIGYVEGNGDHVACTTTTRQCESSCNVASDAAQEQGKCCCPSQPESSPPNPAPSEDGGAPGDGQCCCHCWLAVGASTLATFNPSEVGLMNPSSKFLGAMIESFVPFLWVDSLLRPPQF